MKLKNLLELVDKDELIYVFVPICGMWFDTRDSVERFISSELIEKEILNVHSEEYGLCVKLKN